MIQDRKIVRQRSISEAQRSGLHILSTAGQSETYRSDLSSHIALMALTVSSTRTFPPSGPTRLL